MKPAMTQLHRLLERLRAAPARRRGGLLRYHGAWGPGVRLLQNLRFRNKAWVLVVCLMLPLGFLLWHVAAEVRGELRDARRSVNTMAVYRAILDEQEALLNVGVALSLGRDDPNQPPHLAISVAEEVRRHEALVSAVAAQPTLQRALGEQMQLAGRSRTVLTELPRSTAELTPQALSHHLEDLDEAVLRLDQMRAALLRDPAAGMLDSHAGREISSLQSGGLDHLSPLQHLVHQSGRAAIALQRAALQGQRAMGLRLVEQAVAMEMRLDSVQTELASLAATGRLDAAQLRRETDLLQGYARQVRRLGQVALSSRGDVDVMASAGLDANALQALVVQASDASRALQAQVITAADRILVERGEALMAEALVTAAITLSGLLVMGYLMVCLDKVVGGGLGELRDRVEALARGDMSERAEARGTDEVGQALNALAQSTRRMSSLFEAVTQGVAAVSFASREVAVGNAGLNGRTQDIQRSIEDVGGRARASMEAMNRAGSEVDRIAGEMRDVQADAQRSRKAMAALMERMAGLRAKSREIARVVQMVETVAHQTRLLSLNASVEAARAGTAGKGFAVVAQEVRGLAQRSESAAHKIAEIVKASVNEIEEGGQLSERVSESVRQTDERLAEMAGLMAEIVRLTQDGCEQSHEVVGITRQVEDSAGGNARMVEQLAHASAGLREQGDNLKRSMQHFVFG
jgi:methyl-accepting chemotaxis protein/methyl-accepting chemotaxis protein-1 (serine sensor receptor)